MSPVGKCHGNAKFITGFNYFFVANAATGFNNIFHPIFVGRLNAVAEWEKSIRN